MKAKKWISVLCCAVLALSLGLFAACGEEGSETVEVTSVTVSPATLTLTVGESETLTAEVVPADATDKTVTWESSDEAVAQVSDGEVTAVGQGTATITATAGGVEGTCTVTVNAATSVWDGTADTSWYDAAAAQTAYTLTDAAQLAGLAQLVNGGNDFEGVTITLGMQIDLDEREWAPIGQKGSGNVFSGVFDGNGKVVEGLSVQADNSDEATFDGYVAFFGAIGNATVKNLTVRGEVQGLSAAGIVARVNAGSTIENCVNEVAVTGLDATAKAGGVACLTNPTADAPVLIKNCTNTGAISGGKNGVGGILAYGNANTTIENCENSANIGSDQDRYAGGIVGYATGAASVVRGSSNSGEISASGNAGGIVGIATSVWTFSSCTNSGAVTGGSTSAAGGIAGSINGSTLENCENSASVYGQFAGGVLGILGAGKLIGCAGGSAAIQSPAFTIGFTGQSFTLAVEENQAVGRQVGGFGGAGPSTYAELSLDDENGDDNTIGTVGVCGIYTTMSKLKIVSGTFYGDPLAGNGSYILLESGAVWSDREAGEYMCGGFTDSNRKTEWTLL